MSEIISSNKQIAKNTLFLYIRMAFSIVVSLYTVRVVWNVLGIEDYGIYNVVGGIVVMFSFLNNAMTASSQRFISYELGSGGKESLRHVFSISLVVHILIAIIVLILVETIGLWFLNTQMNIPQHKYVAANWVFQCSVIAFLINIISVPYNACIVAHEHMKTYGYMGMLEVVLKLGIVYLLIIIPYDKLIVYSILVLLVSVFMRILYGWYCSLHFEECHFSINRDKDLIQSMFSFAGWSFIGNLGFSVKDQGLNIVLNLFYNVSTNAAKGIASNITGTLSGFASNFLMAINPQITKRYAAGNIEPMMSLVYAGCKYAALLMALISIPLTFISEQLLSIWLNDVAPYTVGFLQLSLVVVVIEAMAGPIVTSLQATGNIKMFQIIISLIMLSNLPVAWLLLHYVTTPYAIMYVSISTSAIGIFARLSLLRKQLPVSYDMFLKETVMPVLYFIIPSASISYLLGQHISTGLLEIISYGIICTLINSALLYRFSLTTAEREKAAHFLINKIKGKK